MRCDCYHIYKERRYFTDFERGLYMGRTGKYKEYIDEEVARCQGTKERDICTCGGETTKCDFYDYVRERK